MSLVEAPAQVHNISPYSSCDEKSGTEKLKLLQRTPTDGYSALQNGSAFPQHKQHSQYNMIQEVIGPPVLPECVLILQDHSGSL